MTRGLTAKEITEIVDSGILDDEIIKALECHIGKDDKRCAHCAYTVYGCDCLGKLLFALADLINRQKAEIERLKAEKRNTDNILNSLDRPLVEIKSEAIKELSEKITEVFMQYAHLHSHAEVARKDYIEAADGTEIEMQSVWDVFTLQKNGMAEYEEMNRLQSNIETIEKERLLTELEKDFRLLLKEMVGEKDV